MNDGADPQDASGAASLAHRPIELDVAGWHGFPTEWFGALRAEPRSSTPRMDTGMGHAHAIQRRPAGMR